jgi:hypothetical protein
MILVPRKAAGDVTRETLFPLSNVHEICLLHLPVFVKYSRLPLPSVTPGPFLNFPRYPLKGEQNNAARNGPNYGNH